MLDITTETIISLNEATDRLPRRRRGKKPHVATLYRWSQTGCRGVVLETCQVGATRCTSVEALQRFIDRLSTAAAPAAGPFVPKTFIPPSRRRHLEWVSRQLRDEGL
jgi:hypothetical protein